MEIDQKWKDAIEKTAQAATNAIMKELNDTISAFNASPSTETAVPLRRTARDFRKLALIDSEQFSMIIRATDEYI